MANIFYAVVVIRLSKPWLWVLWALAAVALMYTSYRFTYLGVGWSGDNWWGGGTRVAYSFLAGILVFRCNLILPSRLGFLFLSALLIASFLLPFVDATNPWVDATAVVVCFPVLVSLGAGANIKPGLQKLCHFAGEISYPLYMVHYPFIWLFMSYLEANKPGMKEMVAIMLIGLPLLTAFGYVVLRYLDEPVHRWLKGKMEKPAVLMK